jgi:hypothetical protein|nr:MAG TPA: Rho termination factor, N-terminal domain [Caudoviricetes sp.]
MFDSERFEADKALLSRLSLSELYRVAIHEGVGGATQWSRSELARMIAYKREIERSKR